MALDKYQEIDPQNPFAFESDIYNGFSGGSTSTLPIQLPVKWQPEVTEDVVAPVADTAVVLPAAAQPQSEVATTSVPKVISIIQGAVNGLAGALGVGSVATPPFVASPSSNQAAIDAAVKAKQKNFITIGIVLLVLVVLSYFAFKKK